MAPTRGAKGLALKEHLQKSAEVRYRYRLLTLAFASARLQHNWPSKAPLTTAMAPWRLHHLHRTFVTWLGDGLCRANTGRLWGAWGRYVKDLVSD